MIQLSFKIISDILQLPYHYPLGEINGICIDSRSVQPGNLFVAIQGDRVDGHDFVDAAQSLGASAALVSHQVDTSLPCFVVSDVIKAMGKLAQYWREKFDILIIGLTGSNGKTSTKNMIGMILQKACGDDLTQRLATIGNWNNQISLPLNLCRLNDKHRYGVLEMGMDHFGEISYLTHLVQPDVALILNALPSHLAGVGGSIEGVAQAKGEIFEGLKKTGIAVLNADDPFFTYWKSLIQQQSILTFGIKNLADVRAENIVFNDSDTSFVLKTPDGTIGIKLPLLGYHNVMNALGAAASCLALGISLQHIQAGLKSTIPESQRLQIKFTREGARVLDDSYNANPASLKAGLDVLAHYSGTKILALGDMKELGKDEKKYHLDCGKYAKEIGVDYLFAVGELAQEAVKGFGENALHFPSKQALVKYLKPYLSSTTSVLVKGSHFSMHMEEVVSAIVS